MATKLYNKISLREHPDKSPVADASFIKGHSFIYPGDEIVICNKIDSLLDLGGITHTTFTQIKLSIIAQKPDVFSEEFSEEFAATKSFELDSFIIPFTSSNAPLIPWGSDGYAPNINFTQDRAWQLPSGDFRRQIKAFTTHTSSTSAWQYNFWFPIIFDERYWLALVNADNDFYDITKPQNGKNDKWLRYHDLSALPFGWLIKCKFELSYVEHGNNKTVFSEWNLSNEQTGIQDYNSNPDYNNKSIKTCFVGGTPSASNFIFGYQNTSTFGYFSKITAWDSGENNTLTAIFRLRPKESGDRLGSRASSKYPITSQVVWAVLTQHIVTNQGTGIRIKTNDGRQLVTNNSGITGVQITFDPLDNKNIIVKAEIDYNKLNSIFPGFTDFTLYCRLYNGTVLKNISGQSLGTTYIAGNQYCIPATIETYAITGIPTRYIYDSVSELPDGWTLNSAGAIIAGAQSIDFNIGIGSGTIGIKYISGGGGTPQPDIYIYLDVYSDACRMGEEITQDCKLISNPPPRPMNPQPQCGDEITCPHQELLCQFVLEVFADVNDPTNDLHNDKSDFYGLQYMGGAGISGIDLILQKNTSNCGGCDWTDKYTFVENRKPEGGFMGGSTCPYGQFFSFGHNPNFSGNNFVDDYGNHYTGLLLYWELILAAFGEGEYRMKIVYHSAIGGADITDYDIRTFCLHQWNCFNIDGTVRIETYNSGYRGDMRNNKMQIDYGSLQSPWYGQIRLKGIFYEMKPSYNKEFNQYGDSEYNAYRPIIHELNPKFSLDVKPSPGWIDWLLSNYILLSDTILATDYNVSNRKKFIKIPVQNDGGIETKDDDFVNPLALSKISLSYGQNNLRKRND